MPGPIETAYVELRSDSSKLEREMLQQAADAAGRAEAAIRRILEAGMGEAGRRGGDQLGDAFSRAVRSATDGVGNQVVDELRRDVRAGGNVFAPIVGDAEVAAGRIDEPFKDAFNQVRTASRVLGAVLDGDFERAEREIAASLEGVEADADESFSQMESSAKRHLRGIESSVERLEGSFRERFTGLAGFFREAFTEFGTEMLIRAFDAAREAVRALIIDTINAAADLGEAINVVEISFRHFGDEMIEFTRDSADAFGLARTEALTFGALLGGQLQNLGFAEHQAEKFSEVLIQLSADMASAFNREPVEALEAIQAALRGERDTIEKFNVFLNEERILQEAVTLGVAKNTKAVDMNAKAWATLSLILKDTERIQGDFTNTANSLPNLLRRLSASFEDVKAAAGEAFLPVAVDGALMLMDSLDELEEILSGLFEGLVPEARRFAAAIGPELIPFVRDLADAGQTVLRSLLRAFTDGAPALQGFGQLIRDSAEAWAPLIERLGEAAGQVLPVFLDALGDTAQVFSTVFAGPTMDVAISLLTGLAAIIDALPDQLVGFAGALMLVRNQLGPLTPLLQNLFNNGLRGGDLAAKITPTTVALAGLTAAITIAGSIMADNANETAEFERQWQQLLQTLRESDSAEDAVQGLADQILESGGIIEQEVDRIMGFGAKRAEPDLRHALLDTGITVEQLARQVVKSTDDFEKWADGIADAGGEAQLHANVFRDFRERVEELSKAELENLAISGDLDLSTKRQIERILDAEGGTEGYTAALFRLRDSSEQVKDATANYAEQLGIANDETAESTLLTDELSGILFNLTRGTTDVNKGLLDFALAAADAELSEEGMAVAAERLGVSQDRLALFIEEVNNQVGELETALTNALPSVNDIASGMEEFSVSKFSEELDKAIEAAENFAENIDALNPWPKLQRFAIEQGPEVAQEFVNQIEAGNQAELDALEAKITNYENVLGELRNKAPELAENMGIVAGISTEVFGENWTPEKHVTPSIRSVEGRIKEGRPSVQREATQLGSLATWGFALGFRPQDGVSGGITNAIAKMFGLRPSMQSGGRDLGSISSWGFALGIAPMPGTASSAASKAAAAVKRTDGYTPGWSLGADIARGLAAGLLSRAATVAANAASLASAAIAAARKAAGAASPSKRMIELGQDMGDGLVLGLEASTRAAADAAAELLRATFPGDPPNPGAVLAAARARTGGDGPAVATGDTFIFQQGAFQVIAQPGMTTSTAERLGRAHAKGFISTIQQRSVRAVARSA